jgi:uncharacterized protein (DUF427 family)
MSDSATMQAILNGTVLAESDDIVMVDGNPYFPRAAMNTEFFRESSLTTVCGWKGMARYWDVVVGDQVITNVVWAYDTPKPDAEKIRERFAFYRNKGVTLV